MTNVITYSNDGDVSEKLSNVTIPADMVIYNFRLASYNRINAKIRKLYSIPVNSSDGTDMAILKSIESCLAAGRLLIAIATLHQMDNVSEYGKTLIKQGEDELKELEDEDIVLSESSTRATDTADDVIDPPVISGGASDNYPTFDRPMSGIENDAIEGKVDSEEYNSLTDNKTI